MRDHTKYLLNCHLMSYRYQQKVAASDQWRQLAKAEEEAFKLGAEMVAGCFIDWEEIAAYQAK